MLSLRHRLPKEEISNVLRRGTHVRSDLIELIYKRRQIPDQVGDDNKNSRFAFIVSTKIDKRARARNRMRRTLSESVRYLLAAIPPIDGIFVAKKNFADLSQTEVEKIVMALLRL